MTNGSSLNETMGLDLSDKTGVYVVLDHEGEVCREGKVALTRQALSRAFGGGSPCLVAIEVGTHSPWVSRELALLGHEVVIGNPRQVKLISQNKRRATVKMRSYWRVWRGSTAGSCDRCSIAESRRRQTLPCCGRARCSSPAARL